MLLFKSNQKTYPDLSFGLQFFMKNLNAFYKISEKFQNDLSSKDRRKLGIHYTSYEDAIKIIKPCIIDFWLGKKTLSYKEFLDFTVLDPACGCGNFLFIAYQELKKIEKKLFNKDNFPLSNMWGIEINSEAAKLCYKTLIICCERPKNETPKIFVGDALTFDWTHLERDSDKLVS